MSRVPNFFVHAVKNAGQPSLAVALAQQPFHAVGKLWLGYLTGIRRADRRNMISIVKASFQVRNLTVKLQAVHVVERPWQVNFIHMMGVKQPLVSQVVNGKYRLCRATTGLEIRWYQARMPVMCMHNIRVPEGIQTTCHLSADPSEQCKTVHVIGVSELVSIVIRAAWAFV
ncbi:hypothetical protein D3C75_617240 [compost metagenome]